MKNKIRSLLLTVLMCFCVANSLAQSDLTDEIDSRPKSIADIMNFFPMANGIGTAGQPTPEQFALIKAAKYSAVINLSVSQSVNALPNEAKIVTDLGMYYQHISVPWNGPTASHVKFFLILWMFLHSKQIQFSFTAQQTIERLFSPINI